MNSNDSMKRKRSSRGFSVLEMLIVVSVLAILVGIAIPRLFTALYLAKVTRAAGDLNALQKDVMQYQLQKGTYPATLNDIGRGTMRDPWGSLYQYLNFSAPGSAGLQRTDRFGVVVNSNFDVYSMGKDGLSATAFTAAVSQDDIVYASDGSYMGLASDY